MSDSDERVNARKYVVTVLEKKDGRFAVRVAGKDQRQKKII